MARQARTLHRDAFDDAADFNQQLYDALRASPWWMISLAFHVVVFLVSNALAGAEAPRVSVDATLQSQLSPVDPLPDEEPPPVDDEVDPVHATDLEAREPILKDAELSDHNEMDVDMPDDESYGMDGLSDAPFDGPSTNGLIGIGGGRGGAFRGRGGHRNLRTLNGGGRTTHDAVEDALRWLAAHQSADGGWECAGWNRWCDGKPVVADLSGLGKAQYDSGVTGLALLAFLGAGYTNRGDHPFTKVVGNAMRYLKNVQDPEGCFGPRGSGHYVYNHAIAALAMVEAYGMTASSVYKSSAQKGLDFIALARNPYFAWRYGVKPGDNDSSVTGWMMMALKSAKIVNQADAKAGKGPTLVIDEDAFDGIKSWFDKMTDPETGRVGYQTRGTGPARPTELIDKFPAEKSESMTAVGMLARIFMGQNPKTQPEITKGAALCSALLPTWNPNDGSIDMYYWYYATLAMYLGGGSQWTKCKEAMKTAMVDSQRHDGDFCAYKGSWDPLDAWGGDGGRVYSTAILALCLEVYFRYDRVALLDGAK